jgi:hypothetical protein
MQTRRHARYSLRCGSVDRSSRTVTAQSHVSLLVLLLLLLLLLLLPGPKLIKRGCSTRQSMRPPATLRMRPLCVAFVAAVIFILEPSSTHPRLFLATCPKLFLVPILTQRVTACLTTSSTRMDSLTWQLPCVPSSRTPLLPDSTWPTQPRCVCACTRCGVACIKAPRSAAGVWVPFCVGTQSGPGCG